MYSRNVILFTLTFFVSFPLTTIATPSILGERTLSIRRLLFSGKTSNFNHIPGGDSYYKLGNSPQKRAEEPEANVNDDDDDDGEVVDSSNSDSYSLEARVRMPKNKPDSMRDSNGRWSIGNGHLKQKRDVEHDHEVEDDDDFLDYQRIHSLEARADMRKKGENTWTHGKVKKTTPGKGDNIRVEYEDEYNRDNRLFYGKMNAKDYYKKYSNTKLKQRIDKHGETIDYDTKDEAEFPDLDQTNTIEARAIGVGKGKPVGPGAPVRPGRPDRNRLPHHKKPFDLVIKEKRDTGHDDEEILDQYTSQNFEVRNRIPQGPFHIIHDKNGHRLAFSNAKPSNQKRDEGLDVDPNDDYQISGDAEYDSEDDVDMPMEQTEDPVAAAAAAAMTGTASFQLVTETKLPTPVVRRGIRYDGAQGDDGHENQGNTNL